MVQDGVDLFSQEFVWCRCDFFLLFVQECSVDGGVNFVAITNERIDACVWTCARACARQLRLKGLMCNL